MAQATQYYIELGNVTGVRVAVIEDSDRLECALRVNDVSSIFLTIPYYKYVSLVQVPDGRLKVFRSVDGGPFYLLGETLWLLRKPTYTLDSRGRLALYLTGYSANHLFKRRIVAYNAGSAQAGMTDEADDMMKAIVNQNFSSGATDTARQLSSSLFTIQPNLSLAPSITKTFPRHNVLTVLQEIAETSAIAGTYLAFDTVVSDIATDLLEFRTYIQQRGIDHTSPSGTNPVILAHELGNLTDLKLIYDYTDEINYVYAGGQGEGSNRVIQTASDDVRIALSPFNRIEGWRDARNDAAAAAVLAEARSGLREGRPKKIFSGKANDTLTTRFGREYDLGDQITAQFLGTSIDCRVDAVHILMADGKEDVDFELQSAELIG
jgi:hypothetical protein